MAEEAVKGEGKSKAKKPLKVTFKCQSCGQSRPIEEMRTVTRFLPALVVCRACAEAMR